MDAWIQKSLMVFDASLSKAESMAFDTCCQACCSYMAIRVV